KAVEAARQLQLAQEARARIAAGPQSGSPQPVIGVSASTPEGSTVAPPNVHGGVVGVAMRYLGVPYVWGGSTPRGFDCSGLVMYVFAQVGVSLPHSSYAQYGMGTPVSMGELQPGDLVFFAGASHVGIYIGGGQFIHAPHTDDVVPPEGAEPSQRVHASTSLRRLRRIDTNASEVRSTNASTAGRDASPPGQCAPVPSAAQKIPKVVSIVPTAYFNVFSGTRAS